MLCGGGGGQQCAWSAIASPRATSSYLVASRHHDDRRCPLGAVPPETFPEGLANALPIQGELKLGMLPAGEPDDE
jgi:hypothetical protein